MHEDAAAVIRCLQALQPLCERELTPRIQCPRCAHERVRRWGRFRGRQRYRCYQCRRTFSELTGTATYYSKRVQLWPEYCACMHACLSLRRCAARVNISLSTAFRWRHAVLRDSRQHDRTALTGCVELAEFQLPYSMKGSRQVPRSAAKRRGARGRDPLILHVRRVSVVTAWARKSRGYSQLITAAQISAVDLRAVLLPRLSIPLTIVSERGPYSPYAVLAAAAKATFAWTRARDSAEPEHHTRTVQAFKRRIFAFLLPYRGVATKYLDNYLRWHRVLEAIAGVEGIPQ